MSPSNETRKPAGRPSLLSAEQQNALENQPFPVVEAVAEAGDTPRRKHVWLVAGISVLAIAAAFAVVQFGDGQAKPPEAMLAVAPAPTPAPVAASAPAAAPVAQPLETAPSVAAAAPMPEVAAIVDEAPPPVDAKPKESLKQMLESGVPAASKPAVAKATHKPSKEKTAKPSEKAIATPSPEEDNDVELLAALVAHAKYDMSANARLSLPKALEQCKKQGAQDAARCRIRVCENRWRKDECRVYNRSKLEKAALGA